MSAISLFNEKQVRRSWNTPGEKWVFAVVDVVAILTDKLLARDEEAPQGGGK